MQCVGGSNNGALCTNGSECPGGACNNAGHAGPCIYFFGSPLPLRAGGVSTCVVNEINGPISGTINVDDGTSTTSVPLSSKVHPIGTEFAPCPRCTGGTCQDGPRFGQACTVQGTSNFFGDVSLDCPPNPGSLAGTLGINLEIATGTQQKTLATTNPNCRQTGFTGLECFCDTCNNVVQESCSSNAECPMSMGEPGICGGKRCIGGPDGGEPCGSCIGGTNAGANCTNSTACPGGSCANPRVCVMGANDGAGCSNNSQCPGGTCAPECAGGGLCNRPGEATQPNSCLDDTNTLGLDGCTDTGNDEGECVVGPSDPVCETQFFRACNTNADCQPSVTCPECIPGQACVLRQRSCFTDNGIVGNSITVQGSPDVPCGNVSRPEVGTFFCVAPVGATAVNAAGGLPGVGRVRIPGTVVIDP
jgi:hypothetical protein